MMTDCTCSTFVSLLKRNRFNFLDSIASFHSLSGVDPRECARTGSQGSIRSFRLYGRFKILRVWWTSRWRVPQRSLVF